MRNIKIAVIDTGVNEEYFKNHIIEKVNLSNEESDGDENGHGTSTIGEILYCNPNAEIVSIKSLNEKCQCNMNDIIKALDYLYGRDDVDIVNMSFSCSIDNPDIIEVCTKIINSLLLQNKIIINSINNNYSSTNNYGYPANCLGVCKVRHQYIHNAPEWIKYDNQKEEYVVYMDYRLMPTVHGKYEFYRGNSSAAAKVTGLISKKFFNTYKRERKIQIVNDVTWSISKDNKNLIYSLYSKYINNDVRSIRTNAYSLLHDLELLSGTKIRYEDFVYSDFFTIENLINKIIG